MAKAPNGNGKRIVSTFRDSEGDAITTNDDIAGAYREAANFVYDMETGLSDEQIVVIVRSIPGDESNSETGPSVRDARLQAVANASEREELEDLSKPLSAISSELGILAAKVGGMIDTATDNIVDVAVDNKEAYEGAPLEIADHLNKTFEGEVDSDGDILRCSSILKWPVPGTNQKNLPAGSNALCDRYKWTDIATATEHSGHFVGDVHDSTPHGIEIKARLSSLKLLGEDATSDKIGFNYRTKFLTNGVIDPLKVESEKKYWAGRRTSRINRIGRAIKFIQIVTRLHDDLKDVAYYFIHADRAERYHSNKPIKLATGKGKTSVNLGPFGLSQILGLKIDDAIRNGATLAALNATMKRKKKTDATTNQGGGQDKEGINQRLIMNANQVQMSMSAVVNSFSDDGGDRLLSQLMASLSEQSADGKERVKTFVEGADKLQEVASRFRPVYNAILADEALQEAEAIAKRTGIDPMTGKKKVA